jgi:hypothetical protein
VDHPVHEDQRRTVTEDVVAQLHARNDNDHTGATNPLPGSPPRR